MPNKPVLVMVTDSVEPLQIGGEKVRYTELSRRLFGLRGLLISAVERVALWLPDVVVAPSDHIAARVAGVLRPAGGTA